METKEFVVPLFAVAAAALGGPADLARRHRDVCAVVPALEVATHLAPVSLHYRVLAHGFLNGVTTVRISD